jgi:hypothetical protein
MLAEDDGQERLVSGHGSPFRAGLLAGGAGSAEDGVVAGDVYSLRFGMEPGRPKRSSPAASILLAWPRSGCAASAIGVEDDLGRCLEAHGNVVRAGLAQLGSSHSHANGTGSSGGQPLCSSSFAWRSLCFLNASSFCSARARRRLPSQLIPTTLPQPGDEAGRLASSETRRLKSRVEGALGGYDAHMQRVTTGVPARRVVAAKSVASLEIPDIVSAAPVAARLARVEERLLHGLLHFPFGEPGGTRRPRW